MINYHHDNGQPRCALKIDIKKAYDSIGWSCIIDILSSMGTPAYLLRCIKACITTPSFSISVNGELAGFFASKRGLRQGDPLSPMLTSSQWKPSLGPYLWSSKGKSLSFIKNVKKST